MAPATAVKRAKQLATQANATPIDLAEALWTAEQAQPGSFGRIVAETGLGRRKGYYLLQVWERFASLDIPRARLVSVGWTKLALIAKHCPPGVESSWLELAQPGRSTVRELEEKLRSGGFGKPKAHSILLRLSPRQYATFSHALLKFGAKPAKKGKGLTGKERALIKALGSLAE